MDNKFMNLPTPKLIAIDLDGTILDDSGKASDRTISALKMVVAAKVEIVFVTGRPPRWMFQVSDQFDTGKAIIANGAMIYDLSSCIIEKEWLISVKDQAEIFRRIRNSTQKVNMAIEWGENFAREKSYIPRWDDGNDPVGCDQIEERAFQDVYKILIQNTDPKYLPDLMLKEIRSLIGDIADATYCNLDVPLIEISHKGINKGTALAAYAKEIGIDASNTWCFGDNVNDFPMMAWAGTSWIMGNGHPEGRKIATYVAPSFHDDGVAQVLESHFS